MYYPLKEQNICTFFVKLTVLKEIRDQIYEIKLIINLWFKLNKALIKYKFISKPFSLQLDC